MRFTDDKFFLDHKSFVSGRSDSRDLSVSDGSRDSFDAQKLTPFITAAGVLWIILPDLCPGPIDDLFVLLFLAFSNPCVGAILGNVIRALISMFALIWIALPDLCPGPVDDFLLIVLILSMLSHSRDD